MDGVEEIANSGEKTMLFVWDAGLLSVYSSCLCAEESNVLEKVLENLVRGDARREHTGRSEVQLQHRLLCG